MASVVKQLLHLHTARWQLTNVVETFVLGFRVAQHAKILLEALATLRSALGTSPRTPNSTTPSAMIMMRVSPNRRFTLQMMECVPSALVLLAVIAKLKLTANGSQCLQEALGPLLENACRTQHPLLRARLRLPRALRSVTCTLAVRAFRILLAPGLPTAHSVLTINAISVRTSIFLKLLSPTPLLARPVLRADAMSATICLNVAGMWRRF